MAVERETRTASPMSLIVVAIAAAVVGFGAVYVTIGRSDKVQPQAEVAKSAPAAQPNPSATTPNSVASGGPAEKLNVGQMTAFVFKKSPEPLPEISFTNAEGKAMSLSDFKGRTVLLNLWATWCAPCRKEMPDLDKLQKDLGSASFEVVALSVDRQGIDTARKFLDSIKIENLKLYIDPTARAASTLRAVGMPTTILIDKEGREIGRLVGPAEWHSPDAKRLVEASLK